ncbi:MAG: STAS domain-containing protein [Phycisphaeraceae bacterium]|nr:STAS domain-containing protein [Phycisphaeraceae bacterium]MCW5769331.1 STAS domain-containing protein [Phycisphaeraceae bacterium]
MKIDEQAHGAVTVIRPRGPIAQQDAAVFAAAVRGASQRTLGRLVIDASDVPFLDSKGLEAILDLADELADMGQSLRVCGVCETVREALDLTEILESLEQFEDVSSAVRSFL